MARRDRHSRVVGWLKVALPLAALAILSTLFLLSDRIDPEDALPYAEVDVEELAREPRMTAPTYAGMTTDGAALSLTAVEARPSAGTNPATAAGACDTGWRQDRAFGRDGGDG
jgi:lipopolysaccharide export system protein LptC